MQNKQVEEPTWHSTSSDFDLSGATLTHLNRKLDVSLGEIDEFEFEGSASKGLLLRKEILVEDQLTPDNMRRLKARVHLKHESLLSIYGFKLESAKENPAKLSLFFEPFSTNAEAEFRKRQKGLQFFKDEELTSSLIVVAEALAFLQKNKISHGNITPCSILMSQEGEIKLLDHSLFASKHSAYFACLKGSQIPYLSPELINILNQDKSELNKVNAFKADVFALGMSFLYAALLEEPTDCYNWEKNSFNSLNLSKRIDRVYKKYPSEFSNLLSHILQLEISERPDAQKLLANLEYYQKYGACYKLSTQQIPEKTQMYQGAESQQDYFKSSHFVTPIKETQSFSTTQYNFVDPRVQEIIREAREKKWTNGTASEDRADTDFEKFTLLNQTGIKYTNPFLAGSRDKLSKSGFIYRVVTQETGEGKFDQAKFIHNSPEVNDVIASFKKSKAKVSVIERRPDLDLLYSSSIQSQVKKSFTDDEDYHGDNSRHTWRNVGLFTNIETPEKKSHLLYDPYNKTYLNSVTVSPNASTLTSLQYQKKIQPKNEIIRELREKFGSKNKLSEEKVHIEEQTSNAHATEGKNEITVQQIEVKNQKEIEA